VKTEAEAHSERMNPRRLNRVVNGGGPPRPAGIRISGGEHETSHYPPFCSSYIITGGMAACGVP
jgi:hypothetical protein